VNLAILTTVSKYQFDSGFPGSMANVRHMQALLKGTGLFSEVLLIDHNPRTEDIRRRLSDWSRRHQDKPVGQVFWYYSGHGFYCHDARYCGTEFSPGMPEATSISNTEVDRFLTSVQARRVIKLIDASPFSTPYRLCQEAAFLNALEWNRVDITMCSYVRQPLQVPHEEGSPFTRSWIAAVLGRRSGAVKYRHIEQWLANRFDISTDQVLLSLKPGTGHEALCNITPSLQRLAMTGLAQALDVKASRFNRSARLTTSPHRPTWRDQPAEWPQIRKVA